MNSQSTGYGYLIFHVTTARGAIPLEGASVQIREYADETGVPDGDVIVTLVTGRDGNTAKVTLPAPPREASQSPGAPGKPYSSYSAQIRMEGYSDVDFIGIPIFDGITAVQPADLIPLPENGNPDFYTQDEGRFYENQSPEL